MADTHTFPGQPLLFCTCGGLPMTTTTKKAKMTSVATTLAAGEAKITTHRFLSGVVTALATAQIVTTHADTDDNAEVAWIEGDPSEIQTVPLELPEGTIIQPTSLQFMAWGK